MPISQDPEASRRMCNEMPKPSTPTWPIASAIALSWAKLPLAPLYSSAIDAHAELAAPALVQLAGSKLSFFSSRGPGATT